MDLFVECVSTAPNAKFDKKRGKHYIPAGSVSHKSVTIMLKRDIHFENDQKVLNDSERGYLIHNGSEWDFVLPQTYEIIKLETHKSPIILALILESPHKDEYDKVGNVYVPIAPAMGKTGVRLRGGIAKREFIALLDKNCDYRVGLFNAVQYQCSCCNYIQGLNSIDTNLRDEVFRLLFPKVQQQLIDELQNYAPDIIVNCCTGGKKELEDAINNKTVPNGLLNWYVHDYLVNSVFYLQSGFQYGKNYLIDNHPFSW